MGILVDTSVLIAAEKGHMNFEELQEMYEVLYIGSITVSEMWMGVLRAPSPTRKLKRERKVEFLISNTKVLSFDEKIARTHAELFSLLTNIGKRIGLHDLIIAATALHYGYTLITLNKKEFQQVPNLPIICPVLIPA